MSGPPKTPTAILAARNSWRVRHRKQEPLPETQAPEPPHTLSEAAATHWDTLVAALIELDVVSAADGVALAEFAEAMAEVQELTAEITEKGRVVPGYRAGSLIANPLCSLLNQARGRVLKWSREFGLTPAARARVVSNETDAPKDEKSDLLRGVG